MLCRSHWTFLAFRRFELFYLVGGQRARLGALIVRILLACRILKAAKWISPWWISGSIFNRFFLIDWCFTLCHLSYGRHEFASFTLVFFLICFMGRIFLHSFFLYWPSEIARAGRRFYRSIDLSNYSEFGSYLVVGMSVKYGMVRKESWWC